MEKIKLITDAASDLSREEEARYQIRVIPFSVVLGEDTYVPRRDIDNDAFYALMLQHEDLPKTAQVTPSEFVDIYTQEAQAGSTCLILVLINSEGSATYGNAVMAVDMFYDEHPEYRNTVTIHPIDGRGYSALYGRPVLDAAEMIEAGRSGDEIVDYLESLLPRRQIYFGIYSLKWAGKSGRIPSAAAFIGDKLNLKPIMKIFGRQITTAAKVRGEGRLLERICDMVIADMEPGTPYDVIYGSDPAVLEELERLMTARVGYAPLGRWQISAVIAANAGPKVGGVSFTRKA